MSVSVLGMEIDVEAGTRVATGALEPAAASCMILTSAISLFSPSDGRTSDSYSFFVKYISSNIGHR